MKTKIAQQISSIVASQEFLEMYEEPATNFVQDERPAESLFSSNVRWVEGHFFATPEKLNRKTHIVSRKIADSFEAKKINAKQLDDLVYGVFVDCIEKLHDNEHISFEEFKTAYSLALDTVVERGYQYRARCCLFSFDGAAKELKSKYVNVLQGDALAESWNPMKGYDDIIRLVNGDADFDLSPRKSDGKMVLSFPEVYWEIKCDSVSANARSEASWMAGVFVSFIRLFLPKADYCHRPDLGKKEASFGAPYIAHEGGVAFSEGSWSGFGKSAFGQYKIDNQLAVEFESRVVQKKLESLFEAKKSSLAFRMANALGWLAKARQVDDFNERLLYNFTSLEALLSENSNDTSVLETISRSVSTILAKNPNDRESIFKDVKRHYGKRSGLVHRGMREANQFDSDHVELLAERCVAIVLQKCDLNQNFDEFQKSLKSASHGKPWLESEGKK